MTLSEDGSGTAFEIGSVVFDMLYNDLGLDPLDALCGLAVAAVALCHKADKPHTAMVEFTDLIDDSTLEQALKYVEGLGNHDS